MAGRYVFDLETDGFLDDLTKIHCLGIECLDTGKVWDYKPGTINSGLVKLKNADLLVGHNIIGFDLLAIKKLFPKWETKALVRDTLVLTQLVWPHVKDGDFLRAEKGKLPKKLIGRHSLEAWGYRVGNFKGEYKDWCKANGIKDVWAKWTPEMHAYMLQDVNVTRTLWRRIEKELGEVWKVPLEDRNPPAGKDCVELEHRVAEIVSWVERHGWRVNEKRIHALAAKLSARKHQLVAELQRTFPPKEMTRTFTPKANNKKFGYVKGEPHTKKWNIAFNPGSRRMVAERLEALGWKPTEYGKDGVPTVDDDILKALPFKEAKVLAEYYTVEKRLGQIANGKEAWLKHVRNGRIHGRIWSGGAHTGRMTHSNPNVAQTPSNDAPYGEECRDCWVADEGYVMVGADAAGLELRDLAGYMARYDEGAYIDVILRSDSEEEKAAGRDMHSMNAKAIGCPRGVAKTFFYAMIYGSGDYNLGLVLGARGNRQKVAAVGKAAKARLMKAVPALGRLLGAVANAVARGYIVGLDGRHLKARSANAALNTLLQSAGAVQMKRGLVFLIEALENVHQMSWGSDYAVVGLIHDEWQANVRPEFAQRYGETAVQAIRDAGTYYNFRCPLDGAFKIGASWKETH